MTDDSLNESERAELERLRQATAPKVTQDVPPKSAVVSPGVHITYGGKSYQGGDEIISAEGAAMDEWALAGQVTITSHDASERWNSSECDHVRDSHEDLGPGGAHEHQSYWPTKDES